MNSSAPATTASTIMQMQMQQMHIAVEEVAEELNGDEVAIIFSFLAHSDIMRARVCTKWREAAKKTLVPPSELVVRSERSYNTMRVMSTALPNLQQLSIRHLHEGHKYIEGEDLNERLAARTANWITHDINIISGFRKLCVMVIDEADLNGRYHSLFNFPLLQQLTIWNCRNLKYDLDMIASLPSLKELDLFSNPHLTGNLSSLRALKDSLESVVIRYCFAVKGEFIDLADLPRLRKMDLHGTAVTGDIRNIHEDDFPALKSLRLPKSVVGGEYFSFQLISDVPEFMHTIHTLLQRATTLFDQDSLSEAFSWRLSGDSPDCYDWRLRGVIPPPPFELKFIQVGPRLGWSWCTHAYTHVYDSEIDFDHSCEINWLDPEPSSDSCEYETYVQELQRIKQRKEFRFYKGYHQPPTEDQYRRMCEEHLLIIYL